MYIRINRKLKAFGVEKIVWINTQSETVMFDDELTAYSWEDSFQLLPELSLVIGLVVRDFENLGENP